MATFLTVSGALSQPVPGDITQCRTLQDPAARLRCYEGLLSAGPALPPSAAPDLRPTSQMIGRWRLVRTPHPRGEKDAVSIMRSGELTASDPDFVGLMVRCADDDIEVLVVLLHSLSPRARPVVSVNGTSFESKVASPGVTILLPKEVAVAAHDSWMRRANVSLQIEEAGTVTKGLIALDDFEPALGALLAACSTR